MDGKKLVEFINQYYEWTWPRVLENGTGQITYSKRAAGPDRQDLGPLITDIKPIGQIAKCNWCNEEKVNQKSHRLSIDRKSEKKWIHHCKTCNRFWDPKLKVLKRSA